MKRIILFFYLGNFTLFNAYAQLPHDPVPQLFNYQAVARDTNGDLLVNTFVFTVFDIHQGTANGPVVFSEKQNLVTNQHGIFSVAVGSAPIALIGSIEDIDWRAGPYFLEVFIDATGGTNAVSMGTQQLLSVPYAMHAGSTECHSVSMIGDTVFQGNGCYLILPGASAANGGCSDVDGDGFYDQVGCGTAVDCDDDVFSINPDATEVCDGVDNDCNGFVDDVNPPADAGPDQAYCTPVSIAVLSANTAIGGDIGIWQLISGTGSFTNANDPNTQVSGLGIGENIYQWTIDHGPCGSTNDLVSLFLFDGNTSLADAGPDQEFCTPVTATNMGANSASGPALGTWALIAGSGVIIDPNDPNTMVTGLAIGENIFEWVLDNGPCGLTSDQVSVSVFDENAASANAGADQQLCTPSTSTTLSGNMATEPGSGSWSIVAGTGNFSDSSDPNPLVTGLNVGVNTFEWTILNGPCANGITSDQVSISVFDQNAPAADAGPDQTIFLPVTTTTMGANGAVFPGVGTWVLIQGTGNIADPNEEVSLVTGLSLGENIFEWSIDNGPCAPPTTDQVSIFVLDTP